MPQKIYVKIPVSRNGFKDPPKIQWSSQKESELWDFISNAKRNEIDWYELSQKFQVPVTFLQQQTYWMYEKQLEQLRNTIEKGTLSDESMKSERGEKTIEASKSTVTAGLFGKRESSPPKKTVEKTHTDSGDEKLTDDSYTSSSSDGDQIDRGSMLLQRSRILSKVPPKFRDLEEEDEDEEEHGFQTDHDNDTKKANTESSMSNLSSVSISKSALEEAILDTSHF